MQAREMPQEPSLSLEREALARLPELLEEMLGDPQLRVDRAPPDGGIDLVVNDSTGRTWFAQVKASATAGHVAEAARRLRDATAPNAVSILVVPYMTAGAAEVAAEEGVNWVDLAGNARIRDDDLYILIQGRPNPFRSRGRPSSPFAPKSARITRVMLLDPSRWWRQRDLAEKTGLDDGTVSRVVRRLVDEALVEHRTRKYRPRDPSLLLTAWADDYRLDKHDIVIAHASGSGAEISRELERGFHDAGIQHAFTGLAAAWAYDHFARFRLTSVYVSGDPRQALDRLKLRRSPKGGNVQLLGPNDNGVFTGAAERDGLTCVAPVQAYLDLRHLSERADEAAEQLRSRHLRWNGGPG